MALTAGSPEPNNRPLPPVWTSADSANSMQEALEALEHYKKKDPSKVVITASNRFQAVIQFLRKELGWKAGDPLFTYINLAFAPAPDDTVSNLYKSFATEGHLIVNYSTTAAWG
ncbi:Ubiquitin-like protein ATG12 [Abortiporus biennis]